MAYFQGGDFVELLSAQGKAPAAAWKLQGKISKTFDKGIKGNAFLLDGSSETKMQLPKVASSSLGLAQRFVVIQLLVPFTRSFSVEICFSDFQKLPLNAADVPRDQWMNLVFDLQTLSETHFPDTGYRSMESICIGGSCRLKRIFTMKDAPTPSRCSQVIKHADVRDIPRQFVFSATRSGLAPIPTLYFSMAPALGVIAQGVASITTSNAAKTSRRSQTAPGKTQAKTLTKGTRMTRPISNGLLQRKALLQPDIDQARDQERQQLKTPARLTSAHASTSKLRQPRSRVDKVVVLQQDSYSQAVEVETLPPEPTIGPRKNSFAEQEVLDTVEAKPPKSVLPVRVNELSSKEELDMPITTAPAHIEDKSLGRALSPPSSLQSSFRMSPKPEVLRAEVQSQAMRQSILGKIQRKIASLEADDELADQRDRELFLRHTSLHSGEWHLQQLRDEEFEDGERSSLSDEDDQLQLSSSWRRELNEPIADASALSELQQRHSRNDKSTRGSITSHPKTDKESIFSFSSRLDSGAQIAPARLYDYNSLLEEVKPITSQPEMEKMTGSASTDSLIRQPEAQVQLTLADADDEGDDLELAKLLAAKRSARQLLHATTMDKDGADSPHKQSHKSSESALQDVTVENTNSASRDDTQALIVSSDRDFATDERDAWIVVETDPISVDTLTDLTPPSEANQQSKDHMNEQEGGDEDSDIAAEEEENAFSIDLTCELSVSGVHDLGDASYSGSAIHRTDPGNPECEPGSDRDSGELSPLSDQDDDSSFDFEDLVEDAESSDEDTRALSVVAVSTDKACIKQKPATRQSHHLGLMAAGSPRGNQNTHEQQRSSLKLPTKFDSAKSPIMDFSKRNRDKLVQREKYSKSSHSIELSSSFSSRRLQRLLESTDWSAELDAQGSPTSPHIALPARSSDQSQKSAYYYSQELSSETRRSDTKKSARRSSQKRRSRTQTPSTSSIELVYDPLLRCYCDPVANKYYALAD